MTDTAHTPADIVEPGGALVPRKLPGTSLLEQWISGAANMEAAEKQLELFTRLLKELRRHAIGQTYPSDWVIHSTVDRDTGEARQQVGYLQDIGAERAGKVFGIELHKPAVVREDFPQDDPPTYSYVFTSSAYSRATHEFLDYVEGSRWSGDDFFARQVKDPTDRINPMDVRKAAYANLHGRAVRALGGLSAVPLDDLKAAGVDTTKCRFVGYTQGQKGGQSQGAGDGTAELVMRFGRQRGTAARELPDADLAWYIGAYQRDVADEAKAQHKRANERTLAALQRIQEDRKRSADQTEATGATGAAPAAAAPAAATQGHDEGPLGGKRANLWALAQEIGGKKAMPLLKQVAKDTLSKDIAGLTDLTEGELNSLLAIPKATYALVLKALETPAEVKK